MTESTLNQKAKAHMPTRKNWSLSLPVTPPVPQGKQVNSVAVNQDGTRLVAGTYFFNQSHTSVTQNVGVFVYDEQQVLKLTDIFQATAPPKPGPHVRGVKTGVQSVAISRDGVFAASGGLLTTTPLTGFIKAYHVNSGTPWTLPSPSQQTSMVALDEQANFLVAGADKLYIFKRSGNGATSTWSAPQTVFFTDRIVSVAISKTGKWIVAGIGGGQLALVEIDNNGTPIQSTTYLIPNNAWVMGVAMSFDGTTFAAATSDAKFYYFKVANFPGSLQPEYVQVLNNCTACRSVALSDDGSLIAVSAAVKKTTGGPTGGGEVHLFRDKGASASAVWGSPGTTTRSPNVVSIDSTGKFVVLAAGSPPKGPTDGYLHGFDGTTAGPLSWSPNHTSKMDYPIQLSADGSAAVAGSDSGDIYYFITP